jgi:S1-C subfamily serine protease
VRCDPTGDSMSAKDSPLTGYADRMALKLAVALLLAVPALGAAATPADLSGDPLVRAGWLATQATYDLQVDVTFDGVEVAGKRSAGGSLRSAGVAFGVAKGGLLATAAHLAAPSAEQVAAEHYLRARSDVSPVGAADWARSNRARAVGVRVTLRVSRVLPDGQRLGRVRAELAGPSAVDVSGDVAILRIDAPEAPALTLAPIQQRNGRALVVGISRTNRPDTRTPTYETGDLGAIRVESDYVDLVGIDAPIRAGDSGAPVVNRRGQVVGLVSQWVSERPGGAIASSARIDAAVREVAAPGPTESSIQFGAAMKRIWGSDFRRARTLLATPSLSTDPLARYELARLDTLERGPRLVETNGRMRRGLIALAIASAIAATWFLVGARRRDPTPFGMLGAAGDSDDEGPDDGMSPSPS